MARTFRQYLELRVSLRGWRRRNQTRSLRSYRRSWIGRKRRRRWRFELGGSWSSEHGGTHPSNSRALSLGSWLSYAKSPLGERGETTPFSASTQACFQSAKRLRNSPRQRRLDDADSFHQLS